MALGLPGIYVEVRGDYSQLQKDIKATREIVTSQATGMSNALNNALSPTQLRDNINTMVSSLGTLSRSTDVAGKAFDNIGVDLGELSKHTGITEKHFSSLQSKLFKTQAANAQQKALRTIGRSAGLTQKEVKSLGKQFGLTTSQIKKVNSQLNRSNPTFRKTNGLVAAMSRNVLALGSAWLGVQGLGALKRVTDEYTLIDSKIRLVTESSEEFTDVYGALFEMSQKTGTSFAINAKAFANLQLQLKDTIPAEQTLQLFEDLNKSLVINGSTTQEAESFMLQLKQALGSGVLAGEEFRAVTEANSYWAGELAKALGTDISGLRKMSKAQLLTRDVVLDASKKMHDSVSENFSGITKVIGRAQNELSNAWKDIIADTNKSAEGTKTVANSISDLATTVHENKDEIVGLFTGFIAAGKVTVGVVGEVVNAVKALAIVAASDEATLFEMITGGPDVWDEWIEGATSGLMQLKDQLKGVTDQIYNVEKIREFETANDGWTESAEINYQALLKQKNAIDEQILAIQKRSEVTENATVGVLGSGSQDAHDEKNATVVASVQETSSKIIKIKRDEQFQLLDIQKEVLAENKKALDEEVRQAVASGKEMVDSWQLMNEDRYEVQSRGLEALIEVESETTGLMGEIWTEFSGGLETTFRTVVGDGLRGEFDSIGEAFDSVMNNMLSTFIGTLATMAAKYAASSIAGIFTSSTASSSSSSGGSDWFGTAGDWIGTASDWIGENYFAEGGSFGGGWRVVGENGPELEYTGASQIFSNADSKEIFNSRGGGGYVNYDEANEASEDNTDALGDSTEATEDNTSTTEDGISATQSSMESTDKGTVSQDVGNVATGLGTAATNANTIGLSEVVGALGGFVAGLATLAATRSVTTSVTVATKAYNAIDSLIESREDKTIPGYDPDTGGYSPGQADHATSDPGGYADTGGDKGYSSDLFAHGGVADNLWSPSFTPAGEDGFAAMKLGEGVISVDTMQALDKGIKNGSFGGGYDKDVVSLLKEILSKLQENAKAEVNIFGKGTEAFIDRVIVKKAKSGIAMSKPVFI